MHTRWGFFALLVGLSGLLLNAVGQEGDKKDEDKTLVWTHGLSFQVRPAGVEDFDPKKTKKYGAEAFHDKSLKRMVYVCETAALGVGSATKVPTTPEVKAPTLFHAMELRVRLPGENSFDGKTETFGIEVFNDVNCDNLIYVSQTGSVSVLPTGSIKASDKVKDPEWSHGLELKVRKAGEAEWDNAPKFSLEIYKDPNADRLVYVTHKGNVTTVSAAGTTKPADVKGPTWFHAFEVKVRKANEKEFTKDTKAYGVEVYKDENTDKLIYISETGSVAVVAAGNVKKPEESKAPKWTHGQAFRVRRHDEDDFNDKTQRFGAEVYKDEITGYSVYVTESGDLTVFSAN